MLKFAGAALVLIATTGFGITFASDLQRRIAQLRYLKKIMLMLRGEIKYAKAPLPEAFRSIGRRVKPPFSDFLKVVAEELSGLQGKTFQEVWESAVAGCLEETRLTKGDKSCLIKLGENFGYLDEDMQLGTIDLYLEQLELEIGQAEQSVESKSRVYHCLGVLGGLFAVILII